MTKPHPIYDKHAIKLNAPIIIMLIEKNKAAEVKGLKVDIEREKTKQFFDRFDSF